MSIEPMTATTSAINSPRTMCGSALRLLKDGARTLQRYGRVAAVAHEVEAELAARRLDRLVDLPRRDAHALGDELEVVDERLHAGVQLVARRQRDPPVGGVHRTVGEIRRTPASMIFNDSRISCMRTR